MMGEPQEDPVEHYFVTANANPGRVGCPSKEVLQLIARRSLDVPTDVFAHLTRCSDCFVDVKVYRQEFERRKKRGKRFLVGGIIAAGVVALSVVIPQTGMFRFRPASNQLETSVHVEQSAAAIIDFTTISGERGTDDNPPVPQQSPPSYRREKLTLTVILPRGSIEGDLARRN